MCELKVSWSVKSPSIGWGWKLKTAMENGKQENKFVLVTTSGKGEDISGKYGHILPHLIPALEGSGYGGGGGG